MSRKDGPAADEAAAGVGDRVCWTQPDTIAVDEAPVDLGQALASSFRCERAIDAARRYISKSTEPALSRSTVIAFLLRRREPLSDAELEYCAREAIERWLSWEETRVERRWRG